MAEINSVGSATYYAGVLNASNQAAKDAEKKKISSSKKISFSNLLKTQSSAEAATEAAGFPAEIANMSIEDAAVYLKDQVDLAGNAVSESATNENLMAFKKTVQSFIKFIVQNNFEVTAKARRRMTPGVNRFSPFSLPPHQQAPKVQIDVINQKLDELTREMLRTQANNFKILEKVNEIKGLVVDFLQS